MGAKRKRGWTKSTLIIHHCVYFILVCVKFRLVIIWGLSPKNVNWIYEAVVKPILYYGDSECWMTLDTVSNCANLESVLRPTRLLFTGAMSTTATKTIFDILTRQ